MSTKLRSNMSRYEWQEHQRRKYYSPPSKFVEVVRASEVKPNPHRRAISEQCRKRGITRKQYKRMVKLIRRQKRIATLAVAAAKEASL